jgi:choice-of-anchor B domain-containing protein
MKRILSIAVCLLTMLTVTEAQIQTLQKLSQLNFPVSCAGVWQYVDASGNEYALLGNKDGVVIVDVTNPASPNVLFTVPAANSLWRELKTYGHYVYAGTEGGGGITIIDLSGLPGSYLSKTYTGDGAIAGQLSSSHTVQVAGDYLYVFGSNIGTVMCSLADPWNPVYVGTYSANYVHDGYVLNDTLYASEVYAGQFSVVDVTNKANPVVIASQATPGLFNHNGWFSDNKQYFYTTDEKPNAPMGVFDVSDVNNIQLVGTYLNDSLPGNEVHNTRVINDFILAPSYGSQLVIYDAARPLNIIEIARHPTGGFLCWDASPYLPSGNIIATDMDGVFYVFAPYYVRACYLEGNVTDIVTGLPINGANVKILSTTVSKNCNVVGDYKTGYPTAGTFDIEFSANGYFTKTATGIILSNGVLTILDEQLVPLNIGLNEVDNSNFEIHPNPFSSMVEMVVKSELLNENTVATITDVSGRIIAESPVSFSGNLKIDTSSWSKGVYFVKVDDGENGLAVKKIVKQ